LTFTIHLIYYSQLYHVDIDGKLVIIWQREGKLQGVEVIITDLQYTNIQMKAESTSLSDELTNFLNTNFHLHTVVITESPIIDLVAIYCYHGFPVQL